jgi:hypothetical protein
MERDALILRLRAELARLAALYARDEQRVFLEAQVRAYEAQCQVLEDFLEWRPSEPRDDRRRSSPDASATRRQAP